MYIIWEEPIQVPFLDDYIYYSTIISTIALALASASTNALIHYSTIHTKLVVYVVRGEIYNT